jgi:O-antigen/teichoic acid export membrane protein
MISKTFIKSSFIYTLVGSLPFATSFILLPLFAVYLDTSLYGQLVLYTTFTIFMQIIINLSLDYSLQITYFETRDNLGLMHSRLGTIVAGMIVVGVFFVLLFMQFGNFIFERIFPGAGLSFYPFGLYSLLTAFFNSFSKSYNNLLISRQRPVLFFWINLLSFGLTIVLTYFLLIRFPDTLAGPITARLIAAGSIFILAGYLMISEFRLHFEWKFLAGVIMLCLPVLVNALFNWSLGYSDRLIITKYMTPADTGIFDFSLKLTFFIDMILVGIYNTIYPKILQYIINKNVRKSDGFYNTYFHSLTAVNVVLIAAAVLAFQVIIPLFHIKPGYLSALSYVGIITISILFKPIILYFVTPIYALKKTKYLPMIFGASAVIQVGISFVLIKHFGIIGAAVSMIINKPIQVLLIFLFSRKIFSFSYNKYKMIVLPLFYFVLVIAGEILAGPATRTLIYSVELVVAVVLVFLFFKKDLLVNLPLLTKDLWGRKAS